MVLIRLVSASAVGVESPKATAIIRARDSALDGAVASRQTDRREPVRVVGVQVAAAATAAAVAAMWGTEAAEAAFLGGAVAFLPNAYFAWAARGRSVAGRLAYPEAGRLLARWGVKLALAVMLLVFAIVVADVGGGAFFAGLGVALAAQFAAPLVARGR